jgi:hypothetical protein
MRLRSCPTRLSQMKRGACVLPISPLEGEMPGRAEGGELAPALEQKLCPAKARHTQNLYRFNSQVVTRSPLSLSLPSFS